MIIRCIFSFIIVLALFSCVSATDEENSTSNISPAQLEVQQLEQQVIDIHDEVMPLMGTMVTLKDQIEEKNKQLEASGDAASNDQVIVNSMVISNLDQAHEGMMQWMRDFKKVDVDKATEMDLEHLEAERQKILLVQEQVSKAITAAEETLGTIDN
jgi:hypothetical protein